MLRSLGEDAGEGAVQVAGGADLLLVAGGGDEAGGPAGLVHFAVEAEDALQVLGGVGIDNLGGRQLSFRVHAHVQRGVLEPEREAAVGGVELVGGDAEVREDAVEADVQVAGVVLDEAEVVVHHGQARIVRGVPDGIPVTIEGDDARAIV